ncbi:VIT1/CCC1 transporter family protein [Rhabdobacter roseus]|uniref:VIT1/CCC1 family predicted Fe2+/Mn2+ transporter n=1 Tax=Rhabdobacter roseus TaxID=1655419 RepID=A0A840U5A0_9BACT|nr:VIT1/CCC1 transporter family protein [Rhabdobacter roseus]MBB5286989.1 VIT1/CCC1 family predicted Fe2+/Mn2+ transporter [Rhabdobacter roseus]
MHQEQHLRNSDFITDAVIGLSDGLTVPFALAAGLSGAVASNGIIVTAGIAEIVAGSIAMGLGGYLAGKTEIEHYDSELRREHNEVEAVPEKEKAEIRDIFADYGLSEDSQTRIVEELAKDKDKWVDFMMKFELGLERPTLNRARNSALTIGGAYVLGGFVPLLGYFFTDLPLQGLMVSSALTIACLFIFGYFKGKATGQPPIKGAFKVMIVGIIAAGAAFLVAQFLNNNL